MTTILVVETQKAERDGLTEELETRGFEVLAVSEAEDVLAALASRTFDLVLSTYWTKSCSGLELLRAIRASHDVPVVLYGAGVEEELLFEASLNGATRFLSYPFDVETELVPAIADCIGGRDPEARKRRGADRLSGASQAMKSVRAAVRRLAPMGTTVLIHGETGTGKELVARALHEESKRKRFVSVSVPELSEGILESELFGHRRGAFTGAVTSRPGLFETASGGTLFLDEIGDTPLPVQVKLLRALETGEVRPVGSSTPRPIDVRIIAATHCHLPDMVRSGRFREDLFYRLRGAMIHLPPLRERTEDIEAITHELLAEIAATARIPAPKLDPRFLAALARCPWRGNVRELRAVLESALLWRDGNGPLERTHLLEALVSMNPELGSEEQLLAHRMLDAYRRHRWNQEAARRELGLTRGEWRSRFSRLGLDTLRRRRG